MYSEMSQRDAALWHYATVNRLSYRTVGSVERTVTAAAVALCSFRLACNVPCACQQQQAGDQ
jgi:hypothetical protein